MFANISLTEIPLETSAQINPSPVTPTPNLNFCSVIDRDGNRHAYTPALRVTGVTNPATFKQSSNQTKNNGLEKKSASSFPPKDDHMHKSDVQL